MGIPHYFRVITQTYDGIVGLTQPPTDHIFFDFNGAIHQSAKRIIDRKRASLAPDRIEDMYDCAGAVGEGSHSNEETEAHPIENEIMEAVDDYVRGLVAFVNPTKGAYIYMDGVAPHAKLMQQRKRRYLSMMRYKLLKTTPVWDTNAISPGTMFMIRLGAFLRKSIRDRPLRSNILTRLSLSDENGEAEHKIFTAMASIPRDENITIHGLDADLIMLSLLAHRPNITLMREPQDGADFQFLCIDRLREGILRELASKYAWPIDPGAGLFDSASCDAIESYIVWCFLLGNDFLPHMPTLHLQKNGLQKILAASHNTMIVNSARCSIDWDSICAILEELSSNENEVLYGLVSDSMKRRCHAKTDEERVDMYPLLEQNRSELTLELYNRACVRNDSAWRPLYYKHLFHTRMHDLGIITDASREYMTGIEWTYRYYKRLARDHEWYYPYAYAPTMSDLANHIATSRDIHARLVEEWKVSHQTPVFIKDYIQLLCILPPESNHLVPPRLRGIMTDPAMGCTHMYPKRYPILTFLKTRLWECAPVLPPLDIPLLQKKSTRIISQFEKAKPRAGITRGFANGFHIAR